MQLGLYPDCPHGTAIGYLEGPTVCKDCGEVFAPDACPKGCVCETTPSNP